MPDSVLETLVVRVVGDMSPLERDLKEGLRRIRESAKSPVRLTVTSNAAGAAKGMSEALQQAKALNNEAATLRQRFQATGSEFDATRTRLAGIKSEALALSKGFADDTTEARRLAQAARYADATIAGMEGQMSRLGLASQVNLAAMRSTQLGMARFGPVGMIAGDALAGMGTAALGAAAGIAGVGVAAGALISKGIPQVKEMQASLQLLAATGNHMTMQQLADGLDAAAAAAGKAGSQFTRGELSTGLARLVKAGVDASDAMKLLPPAMQLAVESGQSFEQASTLLLANLRQYGLGADEASRAAKDLAVASLRARDNAQGLSEGLASVGPVAAQAGLSLESTLGVLVTLSNNGLDAASKGGVAFRRVLTTILHPSKQAQSAFQSLGVALKDANGHQRTAQAILTDLVKSLNGYGVSVDKATGKVVGQQDAIAKLSTIFSTRAITAVASLTGSVSDSTNSWDANTKAIQSSQESLKNYADTLLSNNLAASQKALDTSFKNLGETLTVSFAPALVKSADALSNFLDQVDRASQTRGLIGGLGQGLANLENSIGRSLLTPIFGKQFADALTTKPGGTIPLNSLGGVGNDQYGPPANPNAPKALPGSAAGAGGQPTGTPSDPVNVKIASTLDISTGADLAAAMKRAAILAMPGGPGFQSQLQQGAFGIVQSAAAVKAYNAAVTASAAAARAAEAQLQGQQQALENAAATLQGGPSIGGPQYLTSNGQSPQEAALLGGRYSIPNVTGPNPVIAALDTMQRQAMLAASPFLQGGPVDQQAVARYRQQRAMAAHNLVQGAINLASSAESAGKTLAERFVKGVEDVVLGLTTQHTQATSLASAMQAGLLQGGPTYNASEGYLGPNPLTGRGYNAWTIQMLRSTPNAYGPVGPAPGARGGYDDFTMTMFKVADRQRQAAEDAASLQRQATIDFVHGVDGAASDFATTIRAFQSGNTAGGIGGLATTAGAVAGMIPGGQVAGAVLTGLGDLFSLLGGLTGSQSRAAPVGGAFGTTRPDIGNPDIALSVGSSQASLGPAISTSMIDAGKLFERAATHFSDAVDKFNAKVSKPNYATSTNL